MYLLLLSRRFGQSLYISNGTDVLYESELKWQHIRDAGLSIKAWLDVNDNNHDAVAEVLNAYVGWVQKVGN